MDPLDKEAKAALLEIVGETAVAVSQERMPVPAAEEVMPVVVEEAKAPALVEEPSPPAVVEPAPAPAVVEEPSVPMVREEPLVPAQKEEVPPPAVVEEASAPMIMEEAPAPAVVASAPLPVAAEEASPPAVPVEVQPPAVKEDSLPPIEEIGPLFAMHDAEAEKAKRRTEAAKGLITEAELEAEAVIAAAVASKRAAEAKEAQAAEAETKIEEGLVPAAGPEEEFPDDPFESARVLLAVGRYQQALDRLLGVDEPQAERLRSTILYRMGRLPGSRDALVKAMAAGRSERDMLDAEALSYAFGSGDACLELLAALEPSREGKAREAAVLLELNRLGEIVARAPNFGEESSYQSRKALASALMLRARYRDAQKVLRVLLEERPMDPEALNSMGICMRHMGEYGYEEPAKLFRAAIAIDETYADAWNNLGCTFFATTNYVEAAKAIAQAAHLQRRPEFLVNLATVQLILADIEGAKVSLTSAMKLEETPDVLFALALIAEKEDDLRWAIRLYEDALAKAPGFRMAQANRDRALIMLRNEKKK
jgi:tetratricopeptide (TPR) repeat protein